MDICEQVYSQQQQRIWGLFLHSAVMGVIVPEPASIPTTENPGLLSFILSKTFIKLHHTLLMHVFLLLLLSHRHKVTCTRCWTRQGATCVHS